MSGEPIVRKVLMSGEVFDNLRLRTETCAAITFDWGEPDADGFYTPTLTQHLDEGYRDAADGEALRLLREALPEPGIVYTWWSAVGDPHAAAVTAQAIRYLGDCEYAFEEVGHGATIAEAADACRAALVATR